MSFDYSKYEEIANFLKSRITFQPILAIICGSGLGNLSDKLTEAINIRFSEIPNFPLSTVEGHQGLVVFGKLSNVPTVCMKGRLHTYEGYTFSRSAMPVRIMKLLGVGTLFVTNAAGGVNSSFKVGDIMLINDHICLPALVGENPLCGINDKRWGPRFLPMNNVYSKEIIVKAKKIANDLNLTDIIHEGTYLMQSGPCYETPAEIRFLRTIGADVVGMSTAHEVIFAHHCGIKIFGLSLITNICISDQNYSKTPDHEEVLKVAEKRSKDIEDLISMLAKEVYPIPSEKL